MTRGSGQSPDLLLLALRYAPLVAPDPPDGLWLDVTGCTHLHGGETRLLRDLVTRLGGQGWAARASVADTPAVAHAVARFGEGGVVPPGAAVMADFPVEALRLPADILAELRLLGFERVGPLAAAARAPLVRRFGALLALRLDQAAGTVFEPITPVVPPALIQARLTFVEPLLTAEAFAAVIGRLVGMVCGELERAGQGARRLDLLFERVDGSVQAVRIGTARPVRDARHLGRMLEERLERVDPGLGVEAMQLVVTAADPLGFVQTASAVVADAAPDIASLVDRLANRLGDGLVYRIAPVESDVPERSVRRVPALAPVTGGWPADWPRPVRLLHPPQPIEAMALLPDHPPVSFTWRRVRHLVRRADGPERIAGEWWKRDREWLSVRDYFRVEDEHGRRFWLFRRGDGEDAATGDMGWFLHGVF
ncbi:MAG TPA: DNA polymerase Y family protein [Rhodopila sp.]|nr:DNA polymerase Y family protein [Rhodopila sp.]